MKDHHRIGSCRAAVVALAALLATASTSASAQDWGRDAQREDSETCERFGTERGSREYTDCMLAQQRRRDNAPLFAAEQQRASAEAARNNVETVRRMRCEREAKRDREAGERPRSCR